MTNQPGLKPYQNFYGFNLNGSTSVNDSLLHSLIVNTATGNAMLSSIDFILAGRTSPIIGRTYNSQDPAIDSNTSINGKTPYVGDFGPGWTWLGDERIECGNPGTDPAVYFDASGGRHVLDYKGGGYIAPKGYRWVITRISDSWQIMDEERNKRKFTRIDGTSVYAFSELEIPDGSILKIQAPVEGTGSRAIIETPAGGRMKIS